MSEFGSSEVQLKAVLQLYNNKEYEKFDQLLQKQLNSPKLYNHYLFSVIILLGSVYLSQHRHDNLEAINMVRLLLELHEKQGQTNKKVIFDSVLLAQRGFLEYVLANCEEFESERSYYLMRSYGFLKESAQKQDQNY